MNPGATSERIHDQIKDLLLGDGLQPGARLDPALIARELAASTTPVREALNRLAGEGVVETRTSGGFFVPLVTEPGLQDLYGWSADIAGLALSRPGAPIRPPDDVGQSDDVATRIAKLLAGIAAASGNAEHHRAMTQVNLRLHAIRLGEPVLFADHEREFEEMRGAAAAGDVVSLRKYIKGYHRRRQRAAGDLVRLRYRNAR